MDSKIIELAKQILANTNSVDEFLRSNELPQPSFGVDGPVDFGIGSAEVGSLRLSTIEATIELQDLLLGPTMLLRPMYNGTSLQAIYKFGIVKYVPIHGEIAFTELAKLCDIYEPDLRRILRFAMYYYRCFRELRNGFVVHTATSRSIVERAGVEDTLVVIFDECWQSYARVYGDIPALRVPAHRLT
ncbi:hypothetical protein N7G274_009019 [Stereocaulon virgatum]|uniref:Uncharacterized protein n=1 Tax=Stereocaulon virgatum TaxID=373712 RepID=A0ABR3ZXG4_9LECA